MERTTFEMKKNIPWEISIADLRWQKNLVNLRIHQKELSRLKNSEHKRLKKNKSVSQRPTGDTTHIGILVTGAPREAKKEAGIFLGKNNGQNAPNLVGNIEPHIQEARQTPSWKYTEIFTHRHATLKLLKEKQKARILKPAGVK